VDTQAHTAAHTRRILQKDIPEIPVAPLQLSIAPTWQPLTDTHTHTEWKAGRESAGPPLTHTHTHTHTYIRGYAHTHIPWT